MIFFRHPIKKPYNDYHEFGRWVLEFSLKDMSLSYYVELWYDKTKEWCGGNSNYFMVSINTKPKFGSDHMYYDGPHCSFSLGFLHFGWSYWWCKKCMPDD